MEDACCYCGGGELNWGGGWGRNQESPVPLVTAEVCFDTDYYSDTRDNYGKDCRYYATNDTTREECGVYDSARFRAFDMCCACGGGLTREEQVPYSEPTC